MEDGYFNYKHNNTRVIIKDFDVQHPELRVYGTTNKETLSLNVEGSDKKKEINNSNNKKFEVILNKKIVNLKRNSPIKLKKRPQSCKNWTPFSTSTINNNNKINFNLKKVIKSTSGKEFTFKITKDIIQKCFIKYSGGPAVLKMNNSKKNEELEDEEIYNDVNNNNNDNVDINEEFEEEISLKKKIKIM